MKSNISRLGQEYTLQEIKFFKQLNSPKKIQDFLDSLKINFETKGETCYSPRMVIRRKTAHCMEGAMLAAAALEFHGRQPLVMDLRSADHDLDHVVAVFRQFGCWGAISKTNHAVLRYREPVYRSIRELAMSYFHEYFDDSGRKTLREYSRPFDLRYFDNHPIKNPAGSRAGAKLKLMIVNWRTSSKNLFAIPDHLDNIRHYKILSRAQIANLRKADKIEIRAGQLVDYRR